MSDNSSSSSSGFGFNGSHFTGGTNDTFNGTFAGAASKRALYIAGYKVPGLIVPIVWFGGLVIGMYLFSKIYRRKKQEEVLSTESWFGPHRQRDTYISLLRASPPVDEKLLQAALLSRAAEDVKRIWNLRERKPAMQALVQRGSLSETTATRFAAAEKELEAEITDVAVEANTFRVGWAQFIFQSASEIAQKDKIKDALEGIGRSKMDALRKLSDEARKEAMESAQKAAATQAALGPRPGQQFGPGGAPNQLPAGMPPALAAAAAAAAVASAGSAPGGSSTPGSASASASGASSPARGVSTPRKGSIAEVLQAATAATAAAQSSAPGSPAAVAAASQGTVSSGSASPAGSKAASTTASPAKSTPGKKKKGKKH